MGPRETKFYQNYPLEMGRSYALRAAQLADALEEALALAESLGAALEPVRRPVNQAESITRLRHVLDDAGAARVFT